MHCKLLCSLVALLAFAGNAACGSCGPDMAARGSASIAWSITVLDRPATCAQVGATSVSLLLHPRAGADVTSTFACTDERGTTPPVTAGRYDATLTLRAADGTAIATAPTQATAIDAGEVAALASIAFAPPPRGKLTLSLVTLSTATNCLPGDQGGAGITGSAIEFEHAGGGCAAVTFTRARGDTILGTYTVDCGAPEVTSCIERDETLTVDGIESGPYAIRVDGNIGPRRCWLGADVLQVPAGGSLVKSLQLAAESFRDC